MPPDMAVHIVYRFVLFLADIACVACLPVASYFAVPNGMSLSEGFVTVVYIADKMFLSMIIIFMIPKSSHGGIGSIVYAALVRRLAIDKADMTCRERESLKRMLQ